MRLREKVAIVTGSSRGIGRGIAEQFLREGARVVLNGRDPDRLARAADELRPLGEVTPIRADVGRSIEVAQLVEGTLAAHGRIDVLVNNAGVFQRSPVLEIAESDWDELMAANLKSCFLCSQAVGRVMARQGGGTIVNVSSDATWSGGMNPCAHYCATKAAMSSLTRSFAKELARHRIRVNAVAPGLIESDMGGDATAALGAVKIPLERMGTPADVAELVTFLAGDASSYMTGTIINITGGLVLDR